LWREIVGEYDLDDHEFALLEEACHCLDTLGGLQLAVSADGPVVDGRPHPALVELRQQRAILIRLLAALSLPSVDGGTMPTVEQLRSQAGHAARWGHRRAG
jgi:hypothetical protein